MWAKLNVDFIPFKSRPAGFFDSYGNRWILKGVVPAICGCFSNFRSFFPCMGVSFLLATILIETKIVAISLNLQ
jgi:hypothetical protein